MDRSARLRSWVFEGSAVYEILEVGLDLGANQPFLALVVLDLENLLGKYGIEVATITRVGWHRGSVANETRVLIAIGTIHR